MVIRETIVGLLELTLLHGRVTEVAVQVTTLGPLQWFQIGQNVVVLDLKAVEHLTVSIFLVQGQYWSQLKGSCDTSRESEPGFLSKRINLIVVEIVSIYLVRGQYCLGVANRGHLKNAWLFFFQSSKAHSNYSQSFVSVFFHTLVRQNVDVRSLRRMAFISAIQTAMK